MAQQKPCVCFIKGTVRDQHNRLPIPGVVVMLKGQSTGTVTDVNGIYQIEGLCPGKYVLEGKIIGYNHFEIAVDLKEGHEENFSLHEEEIHLKEVEVSAQRIQTPTALPLSTLSGKELDQTRGLSLGESLKGIPGVTTLQTGSSIAKPVIHGLHSNRVLILNNGIRQEGQQWGSEHAPEIDPFVATRISLVRGAAGIRYGADAIGGVILVEPSTLPYSQPLSGEVNLAGFSNGLQGTVSTTLQSGVRGKHDFAWRIQGTLKGGGNTRTPHYFLDNTGVREENFSISTGYHKKSWGFDLFYSRFHTKTGIFSGSHIGSVTDLLEVIKKGEPSVKPDFAYRIGRPYQDISHDLLKGEFHYNFAKGGRIQWLTARQYNYRAEYDLHVPKNDSLASLNKPELAFRITSLTNDLVWDHKPLAGQISGQIGISTLYQYNLISGRPLIPNFDQFTIGLFWIERLVKGNWEFEAGLRFDHRILNTYRIINKVKQHDQFTFSNPSGTIGINRTLGHNLSLSYNLGTAWRAPNASELFSNGVHHGAASYEEGNASLVPEKALNNALSLKYNQKNFMVELGGYYNYMTNFIFLQPQPEPILTVRGAFPYFKYKQTDATFAGLDLLVNWKLTKNISLESKLSYLQAYDKRHDSYLVMIPPNRWENELKFQLPDWGLLKATFISLQNSTVARQTRVPDNSDFAPPPPGYSLWQAQIGGNVAIGEKQSITIYLSGQNLLNTTYRDYMNRFRYYASDMGRNVSLRLKWSFGK